MCFIFITKFILRGFTWVYLRQEIVLFYNIGFIYLFLLKLLVKLPLSILRNASSSRDYILYQSALLFFVIVEVYYLLLLIIFVLFYIFYFNIFIFIVLIYVCLYAIYIYLFIIIRLLLNMWSFIIQKHNILPLRVLIFILKCLLLIAYFLLEYIINKHSFF